MSETKRATPLRWKRYRAGYNNDSYALRQAGVDLAIVSRAAGGWYSYAMGLRPVWNTVSAPADLDTAKADAIARVRDALSRTKEG